MVESILNFISVVFMKLRQMPSPASTGGPPVVPLLTQLHEMVYEVHSPFPEQKPDLEIIFLHGLDLSQQEEAYQKTWMSRDNSHFWLKTWLVDEFPKARILTISYDSSAERTDVAGNMDMYILTENLTHALTSDSVRVGREQCPVVLVGHCVGGLLLKDLCVSVAYWLMRESPESPGFDRIEDLFSNLRGMFFYGTPHLGSLLGKELRYNQSALAAQLKLLKASNSRRNEDFRKFKTRYMWEPGGIGEAQKTFVASLDKFVSVVDEASSRPNMDSYYTAPSDHFNICKPQQKNDIAFQMLTDFLHKVQDNGERHAKSLAIAGSFQGDVIDLEGRVSQVCTMLAKPNANKIFIVGLSGIGKSTLAEQVFHELRSAFAVTCSICLDSFEPQSNCKEQVLKKIHDQLGGLCRGSIGSNWKVPDYLKGRKVFMVGDNVQSQKQLDALCTEAWLDGSASLLIVTTTNSRLGTPANTFEVPYLTHIESRQLFLKYAFEGSEGPENVRMFVNTVIRKCDNLPLSLKILGRYVGHEEDNDQPQLWRELIEKMDKAEEVVEGDPDLKIWAKLKPCYDSLSPEEQELFLDIATMFCGFSFPMVECIWNGSRKYPSTAWRNLKKRFLASVDRDGKVWMHTQLRVLGRSIACPENSPRDKWKRISESTHAKKLIEHYQGVVDTRAVRLEYVQDERLFLRNRTFSNYVHLQYLILKGVVIMSGERRLQLPTSLVYLSWTCGLFEVCPVDFRRLEQLSVLDLSYCRAMKSLPSSLKNARPLTWLELKGCSSLIDLGLCEFQHLKYLGSSGTSLANLPEYLEKCVDLTYLLAHNTKLTRVPQWVDGLTMLVTLDLSWTSVIALPEAIGNLKVLEALILSHTSLCSLPESVGELQRLEILDVGRTRLENLPESVFKLRCLKQLRLFDTKIRSLPDGIGELVELEVLHVAGTGVRRVPEISNRLLRLELFEATLDFRSNCLQDLASSKSLWRLGLEVGMLGQEHALAVGEGQPQTRITTLFSPLFSLDALSELTLFGRSCPQSFLPMLFGALQQIPSLSRLYLLTFDLVEVIPFELGALTGLGSLVIEDCPRLCELPVSLGSLCMLTELRLTNLPRLSRLPESVDALPRLSILWIEDCESLEHLPGSLGCVSRLEQDSFSNQSSESETSNSVDYSMPCQVENMELGTTSWRLLECFLHCSKKYKSRKVCYVATCEEMEEVRKKATQDMDGGDYVLDTKVAGELFRSRNSYRQGQRQGIQEAGRPSAYHVPWNHSTDQQHVCIDCADRDKDIGYFKWCDVHTVSVRVIDRQHNGQRRHGNDTPGYEMDSEMEEDEADSEMNEVEIHTKMEDVADLEIVEGKIESRIEELENPSREEDECTGN
ncbi:unnamed protein product [Calypogeia fissa]